MTTTAKVVEPADYTGSSVIVQTHNHTLYSVLDGVASPEQYALECQKRGYPAMSATEHGHMGSVPDMLTAFKKAGLKFIAGCEIYLNDYEPLRREQFLGKSLRPLKESDPDLYSSIMRNRHLTVLAKNQTGFTNLIKLTTQAYKTGYYYRPRIWFDKLCEYKEGLIILSGCLNGPVCHELRRTDPDGGRAPRYESADKRGAIDWIRRFKDAFKDDYWIELQMPGVLDDEWVFRQQIALADHFKLPLVLSNDIHYLERKDWELQKIMMAIDQKTTIDDPDLFHVNSDEQYMKTRAELWARFKNNAYSKGIPDSVFESMCDNTLAVAERCEPLKFDSNPKYPSFDGADDKLRAFIAKRLHAIKVNGKSLSKIDKRYLIDGREVTYFDQAKIELDRIIDKGYSSYFLITQDLIAFGNERHWPFSPRGSAGGSLINFLLGISPINPLPWGLSFDRFLSPSRGGFALKCQMGEPIQRNGQPVVQLPKGK